MINVIVTSTINSIAGFTIDAIEGCMIDSIAGFAIDTIEGCTIDSIAGSKIDASAGSVPRRQRHGGLHDRGRPRSAPIRPARSTPATPS